MRKGREKWLGVLITLLAGLHPAEPALAEKLTLSPRAWSIRYSQRDAAKPVFGRVGMVLRFPARYLLQAQARLPRRSLCHHAYRKPIPVNATLVTSFQIVTQGEVRFNYQLEASNTCLSPATVRAFLQRADDDLYAANGRFWSNPIATILAPGNFTMAIKLHRDQWTNVEGQHDRAGFEALLGKIGNVGITFGGGCFFGHGVNVEGGSARFFMSSFAIH